MEQFRAYLLNITSINDAAMEDLLTLLEKRSFKKGEFFAEAGEHSKYSGFLLSGIMRGFFRTDDAHEFNKSLYPAPAPVSAFSSLLTGQPNKIYIQALTDCEMLVAPYTELLKLYDKHIDLSRVSRMILEQVYIVKEQREIDLVMLEARDRYLRFLENYGAISQQIPLYHIASYLGITPTQLSRIRAALAREG